VESVADAGCLGHQIFAGLDDELQLAAGIRQPDWRQFGFAAGHAGDRKGVARIALASPSGAQSFPMTELRRHLDRGFVGGEQVPGRAGTVPGRALEADPLDLTDRMQPREE
jgi:hypothetical protein